MLRHDARMPDHSPSYPTAGPADADHDRVVLAGEGGVARMLAPADPIQAWIDLMEVVRMLGPPRTARPAREFRGRFLL